jgi:hypothetical protein
MLVARLAKNPGAAYKDRLVAQSLLDELRSLFK